MTPARPASITRRTTFEDLRHPTGRGARGPVRVSHVERATDDGACSVRVGYALGRRFGPAVRRNRGRRRLRSAVVAVAPDLPGGSYLITADPALLDLDYAEVVGSVRGAMTEAAAGTARRRQRTHNRPAHSERST